MTCTDCQKKGCRETADRVCLQVEGDGFYLRAIQDEVWHPFPFSEFTIAELRALAHACNSEAQDRERRHDG